MRILILGGDGMLGHQLLLSLSRKHVVKVTIRRDHAAYNAYPNLFSDSNSYFGVDVLNNDSLMQVCANFNPEVVINSVGIIKQRPLSKNVISSLEVNAIFPHKLSILCKLIKAKLICISTDCVFSGNKGNYTEQDIPDAYDIYGRTKLLGEVNDDGCVTIRSSIIGLELFHKQSLIEWFLAQKKNIKGFAKAIYSGLTTMEMARVIDFIITKHFILSGLFHVASDPITKYELLRVLKEMLERKDIDINIDDVFSCDRSLSGKHFSKLTGYVAPVWSEMLYELALKIKQRELDNTYVI